MIPFVDLTREYNQHRKEFARAVKSVLAKGDFILGEAVAAFEREFAAYCQAPYAVACASGTDALHLALRGAGIGKNDEVIVPVNTFIATALAVTYAGARPVFVDVDPVSYNIAPAKIEAALSRRGRKVKAIIPVHLYGQPADMDAILRLARHHGLKVIEDAAQAHGALYKGRPAGSLAGAAAFSFYPAKNLGAYGDGGMLVTASKKVQQAALMLRNYGQRKKYYHDIIGYNSRLDTVQAAILRVKLRYLDAANANRRATAGLYQRLLQDTAYVLPVVSRDCRHVWHVYAIQVKQREKLQAYLQDKGVSTGIHYPVPLHLTKAYRGLGGQRGDFPVAEKLSGRLLSLPMFGTIRAEEVEYTAACLKSF